MSSELDRLTFPGDVQPIPPERIAKARAAVEDSDLDPDWHAFAHGFAAARGQDLADRPDRWYAKALPEVVAAAGFRLVRDDEAADGRAAAAARVREYVEEATRAWEGSPPYDAAYIATSRGHFRITLDDLAALTGDEGVAR